MDILLYLTELLQTRKTVGIAGLGTLYKKKSPGKYDADQHAFLPPSYTLTFTGEIKEREELANYISQKRNITIDSANYYITEFAEHIQNQLAQQQEADLDPIGKLKLINDELVLITDQGSSFGYEFYGLPTLTETSVKNEVEEAQITTIEEENKLEEENPGQETTEEVEENVLLLDEQETYDEIAEVDQPKTIIEEVVPIPIIETVEVEEKEEPTPITEAFIEEEEPKRGMSMWMKVLIILLIILIAGALTYFINPSLFNRYLNDYEAKQDKSVPTAPVDSLNTKTDSLLTDTLAKNNEIVNLTPETPVIDSSKVTTYEVLVSAVSKQKKANSIIANLAKEGITAKKIYLSKTMINISAGTFLAESVAIKYRDSLRKVLRNPGIYIQPITPKK